MPLNILSPFMEMRGIKLTQQRSINLKKTTNARLEFMQKSVTLVMHNCLEYFGILSSFTLDKA